jgi:excisionase family DNA binding protein
MPDSDEYLTTEEVAGLFKVPVWTVRKWRSRGTGPRGSVIGRHVRYRRSECERWADERLDARAS